MPLKFAENTTKLNDFGTFSYSFVRHFFVFYFCIFVAFGGKIGVLCYTYCCTYLGVKAIDLFGCLH